MDIRYCLLLLPIISTYCAAQTSSDSTSSKQLAMYNKLIHITCDPLERLPDSTILHIVWILPNGELIRILSKTYQHNEYRFFYFGRLLQIVKADDPNFGFYHCMVDFRNGTMLNFQHAVNVNGPYWGNLLEKYTSHIISGSAAAAIMFVVGTLLCIFCTWSQEKGLSNIKKFREANPNTFWRSAENDNSPKMYAYDNAAVNVDEVEEVKMSVPEMMNGENYHSGVKKQPVDEAQIVMAGMNGQDMYNTLEKIPQDENAFYLTKF